MRDKKYLTEQQYSFCLVQVFLGDVWVPMGLKQSREGENEFDSASTLSDELRESGRITCIVPTENWAFVTLDTRAHPIKITPFTKGPKDVEYIDQHFRLLGSGVKHQE